MRHGAGRRRRSFCSRFDAASHIARRFSFSSAGLSAGLGVGIKSGPRLSEVADGAGAAAGTPALPEMGCVLAGRLKRESNPPSPAARFAPAGPAAAVAEVFAAPPLAAPETMPAFGFCDLPPALRAGARAAALGLLSLSSTDLRNSNGIGLLPGTTASVAPAAGQPH